MLLVLQWKIFKLYQNLTNILYICLDKYTIGYDK